MGFNQSGGAQVPLSVFGGTVSEQSPPDLPEGASPDSQDVIFVPGGVGSRPALAKVFVTPFPKGSASLVGTVSYAKSLVTQNFTYNLYLDSNGNLWWEDVVNTPGTYTLLSTFAPGSYAKSTTAFNREYIAINDGLHGADIPLQWDGTYLDRVTQDGPGAPPAVSSLALPQVSMAAGPAHVFSITEADPAGGPYPNGPYGQANIWCAAADASSCQIGQSITISGNSSTNMNVVNASVVAIYTAGTSGLIVLSTAAPIPYGTPYGTGGTATTATSSCVRAGNTVSVVTASAHQMLPGYQVQISGLAAAAIGGGVSSIVINNENLPGVATITTASAHGLIPGLFIALSAVSAVAIGGAIVSVNRAGQIVTVTTTTPHNLSPGALVTLSGVTNASFNTTVAVLNVTSTTVFTFLQADVDASSSGGTISINWPIPDTATPNYFEVISAPSPTTFQVAINYSDSTFTTGTVTYAWDGTFFVASVPTATTFTYRQYGPPATAGSGGIVTPYGQASPGQHQCQVLFLTRQGYITRPSPPVQFTASGGQYVSVSNIPIGPSNIVARILAFTGAQGAYFFYIPSTPQINGQIVGTATQINDNTTSSILLDFSDNTLFASLGISIPGNNLANQIVIDGALAFGFYNSRLVSWGQRNRIQNLLNMSFDGGYLAGPTGGSPLLGSPLGWDSSLNNAGVLAAGHFGQGWKVTAGGSTGYGEISQSAYEDAYGTPILQPNTNYTFRCWISGNAAGNVYGEFVSASTSYISQAFIGATFTSAGAFYQANFATITPATIPADMVFRIIVTGTVTLTIDEMSVIYQQTPYQEGILFGSYVDNPEAFDGVSGKFGPSQDTHKVMDVGVIRQTLYMLTQDPGGRLHETIDNGVTEPAGWTVNQVAANCGLLSAFALTKSQADDSTASGGEEWLAWASSTGARIFGGDQPFKISQEIEPDWNGAKSAGASAWSTATGIIPALNLTAWTVNDPKTRKVYFGLPIASLSYTAGTPTLVSVLDYRELDTAYQIATSPPIHTSFTGKLIATDHCRKWTRWNMTMNGAALMYRQSGNLSIVFLGGNGQALGAAAGHANVYTLNASMYTDDDYGQISPYYTTYFFVTRDQEQQLTFEMVTPQGVQKMALGGGRKLMQYLTAFISGVGNMTITVLCDSLANPWPNPTVRTMVAAPTFDMESPASSAQGQRMALKFASSPATGTDNAFVLQKVNATLRVAQRLPLRGSAT